jgi:cytidylate kinase
VPTPFSSPDLVVAVDGPSGSGKSSVSREVARRLGLRYLDTGAMYRAVTWLALERGVDLSDQAAVAELARTADIEVATDPDHVDVVIEGHDVTADIRATRVSAAVSAVATNHGVRAELVARQQAVAKTGGIVVEGRDITSVVCPDAPVRVLLTASEEARLARRARDVHGSDDTTATEDVRDQVVRRDAQDSTVASFTEAADGVHLVDSSALDFEQTVAAVLALVAAATADAR